MVSEAKDVKALMDSPPLLEALFFPRVTPKLQPPENAQDLDVKVADDIHIGCRIFTAQKDLPIIIFYHGNGEIVPDYDDVGPMYLQQNINFAVADYRGYGWSGGSPLVSTFLEDANVVFDKLKQWFRDNGFTGEIFIMGRSLGSACAIDISVNKSDELDGLILESGFAMTLPLANALGIDLLSLGIQEGETFNNGGKIEQFEKPTFMLHGQLDQLIPFWQAEKLHSLCGAKAKELQMVPGADHNSLIAVGGVLYFQVIRKFIDKTIGGVPGWREKRKEYKAQQK